MDNPVIDEKTAMKITLCDGNSNSWVLVDGRWQKETTGDIGNERPV